MGGSACAGKVLRRTAVAAIAGPLLVTCSLRADGVAAGATTAGQATIVTGTARVTQLAPHGDRQGAASDAPYAPNGVAVGPKGDAVWWVGSGQIGRIELSTGAVTTYQVLMADSPGGIVAGSDGNLRFTGFKSDAIGRITPGGHVKYYYSSLIDEPRNAVPSPDEIAAGPDGNLWFVNQGNDTIGRITPSGQVTDFADPSISLPQAITAGPDGAMWFTDGGADRIGRISMSGAITSFGYLDGNGLPEALAIAAGPDGALWFTSYATSSVFRMTTSGLVLGLTNSDLAGASGITAGPDGALWLSTRVGAVRLSTTGWISSYGVPDSAFQPGGIVAGPDGALWLAETGIDRVTTSGVVTSPAPAG